MRKIILVLLLGCAPPIFADTVIKQRSADADNTTTRIQGDWVRMDQSTQPEFQLWNLKTGEMHIVDPGKRTIMTLNLRKGKSKRKQRPIKATVKKLAKGPKIAGYATIEYQLSANGKTCGKEFVSPAAAKSPDVHKLVSNFAELGNLDEMMPGPLGAAAQAMMDPCDQASLSFGDQLPQLGMPLKSIDASGAIETEVTSIDPHAKLDKKLFVLPADYKRTSLEEEMGNAMKGMQQMMQNVPPEMQQMMQQMFQKPPQ